MKQLTGMFKSDRLGRVYGGPGAEASDFCRRGDLHINMAKELTTKLDAAVNVMVEDFQTPTDQRMTAALLAAVFAISEGHDVIVNCMGGQGRTGLFMACLVGMVKPDVQDPVAFVRENYNPRAVETPEQKQWVGNFIRNNVRLSLVLCQILRQTTQRRRQRAQHLTPSLFVAK